MSVTCPAQQLEKTTKVLEAIYQSVSAAAVCTLEKPGLFLPTKKAVVAVLCNQSHDIRIAEVSSVANMLLSFSQKTISQ